MALSSMTGFAREHGVAGYLRLGVGTQIGQLQGARRQAASAARAGTRSKRRCARRAAELLSRGSVFANLTGHARRRGDGGARQRAGARRGARDTATRSPARSNAAPPTLDGILALKGVIEITEAEETEDERRAAEGAVVAGFAQALKSLQQMRRHEGEALGRLLGARLIGDRGAGRARGGRARPQGRSDQGAARRADRDVARSLARGSIPTGCTRRRSCSPPRPTSARNSIVSSPMWRRRAN